MDSGFEQISAEKEQLPDEELPEMFFFDVDEESEEAEFIRVDDLFRTDPDRASAPDGLMSFTFFPEKRDVFISSRLSRLLRRTLVLSASRTGILPERIRIRPLFVRVLSRMPDPDTPEKTALEIRNDLEMQARNVRKPGDTGRFWANSCLVSRADEEPDDDLITRLAAQIRKE